MTELNLFHHVAGFDWDDGNTLKNLAMHNVSPTECEQAFFNRPFLAREDSAHSDHEIRYQALGMTNRKRYLFIVFTIRGKSVRPISFRDMTKKERTVFINAKDSQI